MALVSREQQKFLLWDERMAAQLNISAPTSRACHDPQVTRGRPGTPCRTTADCCTPNGLPHPVCRLNVCHAGKLNSSCGVPMDCIAGYACVGYHCVTASPDNQDFCASDVVDNSHYSFNPHHASFLATCGAFVSEQYTNSSLADVNGNASSKQSPHVLAESYFQSQLPAILASARGFRTHPYFLGWDRGVLPGHMSQHSLITTRLRHWGHLQRLDGRDDFRVEKSKCDMLRFFERNGLPTASVMGYYGTPREASHALSERSVSGMNQSNWPLFIKACHLTQGSLRSVRKVHSAVEVRDKTPHLLCWLRRMFSTRADDRNRPWTRESNELTDAVAPGFVIQSTVGTWVHGNEHKILELKVEHVYANAHMHKRIPTMHTCTHAHMCYTCSTCNTRTHAHMHTRAYMHTRAHMRHTCMDVCTRLKCFTGAPTSLLRTRTGPSSCAMRRGSTACQVPRHPNSPNHPFVSLAMARHLSRTVPSTACGRGYSRVSSAPGT